MSPLKLEFSVTGTQLDGWPGVYPGKAKILAVKDVSGKKIFDWDKEPWDLGLQLKLDIGRDFQPILTIRGSFTKAEDGTISDWGSARSVARAVRNVLGEPVELDENNKIPVDQLKKLVGKEIWRISYVSGMQKKDPSKIAYTTWTNIFPATEAGFKTMLNAWKFGQSKGYPRNYKPDVVAQTVAKKTNNDGQESFDDGWN